MLKQLLLCSLLVVVISVQCPKTFGQPAAAPAPAGPDNITKILEKAGQFNVLIKLLKTTSVGNQINSQLNDSNNGLTLFAPTDNAFGSLKAGTLNSLSQEQQDELVQFHVIPMVLSASQFQTVSNPLRTQAGGSGTYEFPMNLETSGNSVNISTGVNNATLGNAIFSDNQLAVYPVDQVLLPMNIFGPKPPAPAPSPVKKPKKKSSTDPAADNVPADTAGATKSVTRGAIIFGLAFIGTIYL
ncbi:hypothetical protein MLD38_017298 [Melastoma candidum]|uniref:Uncharacterized protein n=1 Tax=Melastoma candidum TaxID=119954 RepID=A0ACB9QRB9_9MYRT|nr:hypothetical protein MLD38_017298 [Melastoma candidum]